MQGIIYDCEIINCVPDGNEDFTKYKYCSGWRDFKNMGIALIGVIDIESGKTQAFINNDAYQDAFDLRDGYRYLTEMLNYLMYEHKGLLVGFNPRGFSDKLLQANYININADIDLLEEIRIASYGSPSYRDQPKGFKYRLGAIATANGLNNVDNGNLSPQLWQEGKFTEVIDRCLGKLKITREILYLFNKTELVDPNTGKKLGSLIDSNTKRELNKIVDTVISGTPKKVDVDVDDIPF